MTVRSTRELVEAERVVLRTALTALREAIEDGVEPWAQYEATDPEVLGVLTHADGWELLINGLEDKL